MGKRVKQEKVAKNAKYFDTDTMTFKENTLRQGNQAAYNYCKNDFSTGTRIIGIHQGTGAGKSVLGLVYAVNEYASKGKKVLVIVGNPGAFEETCSEFGVDLKTMFPNIYVTSYRKWRTRNVITEQIKREYSDFDFIFADEAHNGLSNNAKSVLPKLFALSKNAKIMAATATLQRHTGDHFVFGNGPFNTCNIFEKNSLNEMIADGRVVKPVAYCMDSDYGMSAPEALCNLRQEITNKIRENLPKIKIVPTTGKAAFIVFFDTMADINNSVDHLEKIFADAFKDYECGKNIYLYNGCSDRHLNPKLKTYGSIQHTIKHLDESNKNGVHVIVTCKALSEGFHKDLNGVIVLQRTKSVPKYVQELGRCVKADGEHRFLVLDVLCTKDILVDPSTVPNDMIDMHYYTGNMDKKKLAKRRHREYVMSMYNDCGFDVVCEEYDICSVLNTFDTVTTTTSMSDEDVTLRSWFAMLERVAKFIRQVDTNWSKVKCQETSWLNAQLKKLNDGELIMRQYDALVELIGATKMQKVLDRMGKSSYTPVEQDVEGKNFVYNLVNDDSVNIDDIAVSELRICNQHYPVNSMYDALVKLGEYTLSSNEKFALSVQRGNRSAIVCCSEDAFENAGEFTDAKYLRGGYIMDNTDGRRFYCNIAKESYTEVFATLLHNSGLTVYDVAVQLN